VAWALSHQTAAQLSARPNSLTWPARPSKYAPSASVGPINRSASRGSAKAPYALVRSSLPFTYTAMVLTVLTAVTLRDALLDREMFGALHEAQVSIEGWRQLPALALGAGLN